MRCKPLFANILRCSLLLWHSLSGSQELIMLALVVKVLILAIAAGVVLFWSTGERPSWPARGISLLLLIMCILAVFFA
jgi:hypothetical protein